MRVLVTNANRNAGMAVVRALAAAGYEVIGADYRRLPLGIHSRFARTVEPLPPEYHADFCSELLGLVRRWRPDVLIPFSGSGAVSRRLSAFEELTNVLLPEYASYRQLNDKKALLDACSRLGLPGPVRLSADEAKLYLKRAVGAARVVLKPRVDMGGGRGVRMVSSAQELEAAIAGWDRRLGNPLITEHVPGDTESNRALHLLFDRESRLIAAMVIKKTTQWPRETGITASAVVTDELALVERYRPLFEHLRWRGPADVEVKLDARDGEPKILEVNTRFSGAIGFTVGCGVNMPVILARAAAGERMPRARVSPDVVGRRYINPGPYLRACMQIARTRGIAALGRAVRGDTQGGWITPALRLDDPMPMLAKLFLRDSSHPGEYPYVVNALE